MQRIMLCVCVRVRVCIVNSVCVPEVRVLHAMKNILLHKLIIFAGNYIS